MKRADAVHVEWFMHALAAEPDTAAPLPEAAAILRRARLRARLHEEQQRADRAALPMIVTAVLGPCLALLALSSAPLAAAALATLAAVLGGLAVALSVRLLLAADY